MFPSRETRGVMSSMWWVGVVVIALIALAVFLWLVAYPAFLNWQRSATQHSQPFIQSKVRELSDLKAQYERLEVQIARYSGQPQVIEAYRSQEAAIINQMWDAYDLIPSDIRDEVVPNHIKAFLTQHSRVPR